MSDHHNGKKFYNPTLPKESSPNIFDIFRLLKEPKSKWPKKVGNNSTPKIKNKLSCADLSITFINHATFLIQIPGLNILTDPIWSKRASPFKWIGPKRVRDAGVKLEDLPNIDIIIISHNHYDHLDIATLKQLNRLFAPIVIVPIGDKPLIKSIGIKKIHELDWWEYLDINSETRITFTPAQHASARSLFDRNKSLWGSFYIKYRNRSVYFGGDSGFSVHYRTIKERLGSPEIALLGIGAYNPRWFMAAIHMNPYEAVIAHKELGAILSIGMHFGTFCLSSEAIDQPQKDLKSALKKENIPDGRFITLNEGETKFITDK